MDSPHNNFLKKVIASRTRENKTLNEFHKLYYDAYKNKGTWYSTFWLGTEVQKCPLDLWIYQEIIHELKPDLIIETGTLKGGSALYLASICDLVGKGKVVSIDINRSKEFPRHRRITYLTGSSTSIDIIEKLRKMTKSSKCTLVILDSDHSKFHVLNELNLYAQFVTKGSYMILEDTNINGHPVFSNFGEGPMEALKDFFKINKDFIIDRGKEKLYLSFNPKGYLKKITF